MLKALLFGIPAHAATGILSTWISVSDLGRLDSAACTTVEREPLLKTLCAPDFIVSAVTLRGSRPRHIMWHISRNVKWTILTIDGSDGEFDSSLLCSFFIATGSDRTTSIEIIDYTMNLAVINALIATTCKGLHRLYLKDCNASSAGLEAVLHHCGDTLRALYLVDCEVKLTNDLLPVRLENLQRLSLENIQDVNTVYTLLTCCRELRYLYLNASSLDNNCIGKLSNHAGQLEELHLIDSAEITDTAVVALAKKCPVLKKLTLMNCEKLTDRTVTAFVQHCPQLESLRITATFTEVSLLAIATHCGPRLKHLSLFDMYRKDDSGILALAEHCTALESLACNDIVDTAVSATKTLVAAQHYLKELGLANIAIDDEILSIVARLGSQLEHLSLYEATGYTRAGLMQVAQHCTNLTSLYVNENNVIVTPGVVDFWQLMRPKLAISYGDWFGPHWEYNTDD